MDQLVYFSDSLGQILKTFDPDQKQLVGEMFKHWTSEYLRGLEENDPISVIYSFHCLIDEHIQQKFDADPESKDITCKKGCYYCCQQNVDASIHEALLLLHIMEEESIEIDMDKLKRQAKHNVETWHDQPLEDWDCIFLKDGCCAVYEHRPASCRKYFVSSIPKLCDTKDLHQVVKRFVCVIPEILGSVIYNQPGSGSMPKVLIDSLNLIQK